MNKIVRVDDVEMKKYSIKYSPSQSTIPQEIELEEEENSIKTKKSLKQRAKNIFKKYKAELELVGILGFYVVSGVAICGLVGHIVLGSVTTGILIFVIVNCLALLSA